ncbi:ferritin-like domain-containing protein [Kineosporia mesophila]|uniref:Ferritin-like domain-containing protein n=1 Tax=Kineosporia mesophila TaxID=566012 RepID=A0ABP6Z9I4_9ACTN|nr:ferritin-like domain-containing protein [Kineosporia mesophila]MCD5353000.1 ferritin-like domain-containing protein [Kineosporia mesophila]
MFGKKLVVDMIDRSSQNQTDRRRFLRAAGAAGMGAVGAGVVGTSVMGALSASADSVGTAAAPSDGAVLNFALNLEYLEAEFYSYAVHGHGLADKLTSGLQTRGGVVGGKKVPFKTKRIAQYAAEIAGDELAHVKFLRSALGKSAVSRPKIDIKNSFTAAARAAGLISSSQTFDPFANEDNFLLGAFLFEDVGVTAYKGAAPLIDNKAYLEAAAGILAVEAYHAATIRTSLYEKGLYQAAGKISMARDALDGGKDGDQGIRWKGMANIVPAAPSGIAYSRSPGKVLNVVYLNTKSVKKGGFFPNGVHGAVNTSA